MTRTNKRTGFVRHFLSGFALGAVALVGVQIADRSEATPSPYGAPIEATR